MPNVSNTSATVNTSNSRGIVGATDLLSQSMSAPALGGGRFGLTILASAPSDSSKGQ